MTINLYLTKNCDDELHETNNCPHGMADDEDHSDSYQHEGNGDLSSSVSSPKHK